METWIKMHVFKWMKKTSLDCQEIKPVNPKGNQSWIFIGRTDAEAEAPVLWPPDAKSWLIRKDPNVGKGWRQKGMTEGQMVGWHHWLNGHEFEQAPGDGEGQRNLECYSPWDHKESDTTEQLNKKWNSSLAHQQLTSNPHIKKLQTSIVIHIKPSFKNFCNFWWGFSPLNEKLKKKLTFVACLLCTKSCNIFQVRKEHAVMIWSVTLLLLFRGCQVPGIMCTHDLNIPSVGHTSHPWHLATVIFFFNCFCHNIVDSQEWFACLLWEFSSKWQ